MQSEKLDILHLMPEIEKDTVRMKDKKAVIEKIYNLVAGGVETLQLVSDFDMTLTKQHEDGKRFKSSFGLLYDCPSIPESYVQADRNLYVKYRPLEVDPNITTQARIEYMDEWWQQSENLLKGLTLNLTEIMDVAKEAHIPLRDGTAKLVGCLNDANVPILIFSAGLGDCVEAVLKTNELFTENMKIISNFLNIEGDSILGFKDEKITVMNKNEAAIVNNNYFQVIKNRTNVLLMGDHLGDAKMVDGLITKTVLKIGFLYENVEEHLPEYLDAFDIVLIDDQTMDIPNAIVKLIVEPAE